MRLLVTTVLILVFATPSAQADSAKNLVEVAVEAGSFKTLARAVEAAGLLNTLQEKGPFTVFAPTDAAFEKLPAGTLETLLAPENVERLRQILSLHVVAGDFAAARALSTRALTSLSGEPLAVRLSAGSLRVNGVRVINNDITAKNGVIHVIDSVLLPPAQLTPTAAMLQVLELAVERGVPLFNDGNHGACAAIYEVAITSLATRPEGLAPDTVKALRKALAAVEGSQNLTENAWILREAIDRTMVELLRVSRTETPVSASSFEMKTIFGFDGSEDEWFTVNDDVMGGVSRARYELSEHGTAFFKGALSLDNNGGFATVRSPARDMKISDYTGLILRVRGDGRTYGISGLPSSKRFEVNVWKSEFETKADEWIEVRVPFESLTHNVMGRRIPGSGPLQPSRLRSIALSISDKDETPFELEIDWIKAYKSVDDVAYQQ